MEEKETKKTTKTTKSTTKNATSSTAKAATKTAAKTNAKNSTKKTTKKGAVKKNAYDIDSMSMVAILLVIIVILVIIIVMQLVNQSKYKMYKNVISQEEVENTLFNQPISESRNGEYRIGIKTATDGDFHATLTVYKAKDGKYEEQFSCPAVVGKNGPGKQSEGDTKTPLGTWKIGLAYGINDDPGSRIPYTKITDDMYWCATGSNDKYYNTLIYKSQNPDLDYSEDEHLIDYPGVYNYLLDLGYNKAGAPYAGNAIFLHCWRGEDQPTGGCVGISEENMIKVLQTVPAGSSVTIY